MHPNAKQELDDVLEPPAPQLGSLPLSMLSIMQKLSHASTLENVIEAVHEKARELVQADGVAFVLKDGQYCHYVDENAIGPLWKGMKFPMEVCISGWAMLNQEAVALEDIYTDSRIPIDAYKVTFVKSLAVVPIRKKKPIGAIGFYWASRHKTTDEELVLLQALADSVSIAMENVALYAELQSKVKALQESNYELSRFAWIASHDLQEPLRTITTQVELLARRYEDKLDARAKEYIKTATGSANRLQHLVENLLAHARIEQSENYKPVVLTEIVQEVLADNHMSIVETGAHITYDPLPWLWCEKVMIRRLFQNLISNAIKFHKPNTPPLIHITCIREEGTWHFVVSDNGIGIEKDQLERIFGLFQRVHTQTAYPGSGIGLATCRKIVSLHQGSIWAESMPNVGTSFHFVLPLLGEAFPKENT